MKITNNIVTNNVAGWDGGGISLQDALNVDIINNTIMANDSTASAGPLFNTIGAPNASVAPSGPTANLAGTQSLPQPAGLVSIRNTAVLSVPLRGLRITCPTNHPNCTVFSNPYLENDIFYQNRSFYIGVGGYGTAGQNQQKTVALFTLAGLTPLNQSATGSCPSNSSYWDLGVRGDTGPTNHTLQLYTDVFGHHEYGRLHGHNDAGQYRRQFVARTESVL